MVITPVQHGKIKDLKYIKIRIHDGGATPKFKSTGHKIKPKYWNKKGNVNKKNWVKTSHLQHSEINTKIYEMLTQIEKEMLGESAIEVLKPKANKLQFLVYFEEYNSMVRNSSTKDTNESAIKTLTKYLELNDKLWLSFNDINKKFVKLYYNWLLNKYAESSANQYLGVFRSVYNAALQDEYLKIKVETHPFANFKYEKEKTVNTPLSKEDFDKFKNYEPFNRKHEIAKNLWLLQFSQACRVKDVLFLKWNNLSSVNGEFYLNFFTSKTGDRVSRKLDLAVIELFVTGFERYFPNISDELNGIEKKIGGLIEHIKNIESFTPKPLTNDDFIRYFEQGLTTEEIQEKLKEVKKGKEILSNAASQLEGFLIEKENLFKDYLNKIKKTNDNDFIWDKPQEEDYMVDDNSTENHDKYKRCAAQNHGILIQIRKRLGITTQLSSHVARYTASQFMLNDDVPFNQMSQYLTHSSHSVTEFYVNRMGKRNDKISELLTGYFKR